MNVCKSATPAASPTSPIEAENRDPGAIDGSVPVLPMDRAAGRRSRVYDTEYPVDDTVAA